MQAESGVSPAGNLKVQLILRITGEATKAMIPNPPAHVDHSETGRYALAILLVVTRTTLQTIESSRGRDFFSA